MREGMVQMQRRKGYEGEQENGYSQVHQGYRAAFAGESRGGWIQSFLKEECFYKTVWRQEDCFCADHWRADDGLGKNLKKLFFFKYEYQAGFLHIEAWIREGKNRERGSLGLLGMI